MQLTPYEIALISGGFGITGTLLGVILSHRLALKIARVNFNNSIRLSKIASQKEAARKLQTAFSRQLSTVRFDQGKSSIEIQRFLERSIEDVTLETEIFRFYVRPEDLGSYDRACQEYQNIARIRDMNYATLNGEGPFKILESKVHNILEFTKPLTGQFTG